MPRLPLQWRLRLLGGVTVSAILGFLLLPALVVTLAAFNSRAILSFPPESWSWRWFVKALAYDDFRFQRALEAVLLSPLVVPHFTVGLGFLILAAQLGMARGYGVIVACHVV